ncbi:hypothetical protein ET445_00730 [Agromyces protaetiae]|uniref:Caspase family protein n=1 Tax=Agromyces protaetiae TaxID=2509455 RepID=A0A4P6F8J6_9MICO|nr:caspase family protein [Agromyces protaetiae]QAY72074.1 hypothetical protein ET445_00730 [Agromyces protaetiae]
MGKRVFALLVGIDEYPDPVPRLAGCKNDVDAIESLLSARVASAGDTFHPLRLVDEQATRDEVIDAFRSHLGQAGEGDVALFYYSGHGSQESAPQEFWSIEPDHLDETLVLFDSRSPGKWDLADKELAVLLSETEASSPHVLVVLDCCHSGSGTRGPLEDGTAIRRAPLDRRARPIEAFLPGAARVAEGGAAVSKPAVLGDSGWAIRSPRHVLLSGCRSNETSKEVTHEGKARGAMSVALHQALSTSGGGSSYRDIHRRVSAGVRASVREQNPQLETSAAEDLDRTFLDGAIAPLPGHFVVTRAGAKLVIDGGQVHGIVAPVGGEFTVVGVLAVSGERVATARVTEVRVGDSTIELDAGTALEDVDGLHAIVIASPVSPIRVAIDGDVARVAALRDALRARDTDGPLLVAETTDFSAAELRVDALPDRYRVRRSVGERDLCPSALGPEETIGMLEHLARWSRVAALRNGATRLPDDVVAVTVSGESKPLPDGSGRLQTEVDGRYRFEYVAGDDGRPRPAEYTVTVANTAERSLFIGLLDLTDTFGVYCDDPIGYFELQGGEEKAIELKATVPQRLFERGRTEVTDLLKLVVSTSEFDPRTVVQDDLDPTALPEREVATRGGGESPKSTLDRLMRRVGTRRAEPAGGSEIADWFTIDVEVTAVRPRDGVEVDPVRTVEIADGVRVRPHPGLQATLRLTHASDATRDLGAAPVPAALQIDGIEPFGLVATRGGEAELDSVVVEFGGGASGLDAVTPASPLVLELDRSLGDDERVLPFAWDGEFYIPLGFGRATAAGSEIVIQRLPEPVSTTRSLFGSIRILFRRLIRETLGIGDDYPLLQVATVADDGEVEYERDPDEVRRRVAAARSVLLYVHGIIGDTKEMARSSRFAAGETPVGAGFDVILTFDYESIGTGIADTGKALAKRLVAAGLGTGHGKRLDIVAHSMGGLVSRYAIEVERSVDVSTLVTFGTPNAGSPWPTVQDWATTGLGLAANAFAFTAWPVAVVGWLVGALERVDAGLDDLAPDSDFYRELKKHGQDPGVQYHVIVGDRSLVETADPGTVKRLVAKLMRVATDLPFFGQPNDIAVSVVSAKSFPAWAIRPPVSDILPSDHLSYFRTPATLRKLAQAIGDVPPDA